MRRVRIAGQACGREVTSIEAVAGPAGGVGVGAGGAVDVDVSMRELWLAFGGWTVEARAWQLRSRPPRARVTLF